MIRATAISALIGLSFLGCGGRAKPAVHAAAPNAVLGDCTDPRQAGVLGETPNLRAAHRDLNGDGTKELAYADKTLCRRGNCYWNLFVKIDGCDRYIGTIPGATLEILPDQSSAGFHAVRSWWALPGGTRRLVQSYRFRRDGYQIDEVLVCRQVGDQPPLCATEEQTRKHE